MFGQRQRRGPVEAVLLLTDTRPGGDVQHVSGVDVVAVVAAVVGRAVRVAGVPRVGLPIHAVAKAVLHPVVVEDARPAAGLGRTHERVIVLEATVHPVGVTHVHADGVELGDGEVVELPEVHAPVVGLVKAGVAAQVEVLGIARVDPHGVVVGVHAHVVGRPHGDLGERAPAVVGLVGRPGQLVDEIFVARIDEDLGVVHGPPVQRVHPLPGRSTVLCAVSALLGRVGVFDEGVEDPGVGRRDGQADTAHVALGEPVAQLDPMIAAIGGHVDAATGTSSIEPP